MPQSCQNDTPIEPTSIQFRVQQLLTKLIIGAIKQKKLQQSPKANNLPVREQKEMLGINQIMKNIKDIKQRLVNKKNILNEITSNLNKTEGEKPDAVIPECARSSHKKKPQLNLILAEATQASVFELLYKPVRFQMITWKEWNK